MSVKVRFLAPAVLCFLALFVTSIAAEKPPADDDLAIDDYSFTWNVLKIGDARLCVSKDQNATTIDVRDDMHSVSMAPAVAVEMGAVLARTEEFYKKFRGNKQEVSETVSVKDGDVEARFWQTPKYGFVALLSEKGQYGSVSLDRKTAKAFAAQLKKAAAMAKMVDEKIRP